MLAIAIVPMNLLVAQGSSKPPLGIFESTADIGNTRKGAAAFSAGTESYRVTGGGADLWGKEDDFRFLWLPITGDAVLEADVTFPANEVVPKEKAMLIFRQSVNPDAAYADLAIHGDGHIALQFRKNDGGQTEDLTAPGGGSKHLRLERQGDHFIASLGSSSSKMAPVLSTDVALHGLVLVGLGVCAHHARGLNTVVFSNLRIIIPKKQ